jgi:PAS domain S-box-containing protein
LANHTLLIAKNGTEIPIDDSGSPIRAPDGTVFGAVLIFRDITGRRKAERMQAGLFERERLARQSERAAREAAEAAELRLKLALNAGRMGTWEYRITTGKVIWSPGLEQIHGYESGTFPGTFEGFRDEIHPDDRERVLQALSEAIGQRRDHHVEYRIIRRDGSVRWVEGRGRLFLDADGNPDRMVGVCADVTERKNAEQAESEARRAAEEANRAKDEFLAMVSHELRNPLSAILGWAAILNKGDAPAEHVKQAYEVIERNARAEVRLVESLLDLSRIVAGQMRLDSERVDLPALLETVIDSVRPAADAKAIRLEITAPRGIILIGDSDRLQQIFSNLLTNAVKFTPRGGLIQVRVTRSGSHAQIQVIDNGEGIHPGFLPQIFDRFRQAESTTSRMHGGLGLGLAIVRELVHAHRGTVTAESPGKGQGSTFTVTLPIPAVIPADIEAARPPLVHKEVVSLSGLRVLVVDDDADARELVGIALESRGAVVQLASSASEALRLISRDRPDVMIADIGMPQEDGYVLIQTLRALEREHSHSRLPAIALTAYASAVDRHRTLAAGYDVHLAKPVGPADLIQAAVTFRKATQREA